MTTLIKKRLVLASAPSSAWEYYQLSMLYGETDSGTFQFEVRLRTSVDFHGFGKQDLSLVIRGDNLLPNNSLDSPNGPIKIDAGLEIARGGRASFKELVLALKNPCVLLYDFAKCGNSRLETSNLHVVTLAHADKIRILFDSNWLGKRYAMLQRVVHCKLPLDPLPANVRDAHAIISHNAPASSNLFYVAKADAPLPSTEVAEGAPPPYNSAPPPSYAPTKRLRSPDSPTSPLDQPLSKRTAEKTSPPQSISPAGKKADPVEAAIPQVLHRVREALPDLLGDLLPGLLRKHSPDQLHPVVIVGDVTSEHFHQHCMTQITAARDEASERILDESLDHQRQIIVAMEDTAEDHRVGCQLVMDDNLADLGRMTQDKLEQFEQMTREELEQFEQRIEQIKMAAEDDFRDYVDKMHDDKHVHTVARVTPLGDRLLCTHKKWPETVPAQPRRASSMEV